MLRWTQLEELNHKVNLATMKGLLINCGGMTIQQLCKDQWTFPWTHNNNIFGATFWFEENPYLVLQQMSENACMSSTIKPQHFPCALCDTHTS